MVFAVLGYVMCKFYEKSPYTLPEDKKMKRFNFDFPGR